MQLYRQLKSKKVSLNNLATLMNILARFSFNEIIGDFHAFRSIVVNAVMSMKLVVWSVIALQDSNG